MYFLSGLLICRLMNLHHPIASLAQMLDDWPAHASLADGVARVAAWMQSVPAPTQAAALALLYKGAKKRLVTLAQFQETLTLRTECPAWLWQACAQQSKDLTEACALLLPVEAQEIAQNALHHCLRLLVPPPRKAPRAELVGWLEVYTMLDVPGRYYWLKMLQGSFKTKIPAAVLSAWLQEATGASPWQASKVLELVTLDTYTPLTDLLAALDTERLLPVPYPRLLDTHLETLPAEAIPEGAVIAEPFVDATWVQWQRKGTVWALWDVHGIDLSARYPVWSHLIPVSLGNVHFTALWWSDSVSKKPVFQIYDLHEWETHALAASTLSQRLALAEELCKACGGEGPAMGNIMLYKSREALVSTLEAHGWQGGNAAWLLRPDTLPGTATAWRLQPPRKVLQGVLLYTHWEQQEGVALQWLTLGMWNGTQWVTVCKVKNELEVPYVTMLQAWIKKNITERSGPVRMVPPVQVIRFTCASVLPSKRHKCGYQVTDPVIDTWLRTTGAEEIPGLQDQLGPLVQAT